MNRFLVICGLVIGIFVTGCSQNAVQKTNRVCFQNACVNVEVVRHQEEMRRGLQFRDYLAPDAGMLFVFEKSWRYSFWMKDTRIPLDMIWMDYARRIVYIEQNVPPCAADPCPRYTPTAEALYVLEVNAGYAQKHKLEPGLAAEFKLR